MSALFSPARVALSEISCVSRAGVNSRLDVFASAGNHRGFLPRLPFTTLYFVTSAPSGAYNMRFCFHQHSLWCLSSRNIQAPAAGCAAPVSEKRGKRAKAPRQIHVEIRTGTDRLHKYPSRCLAHLNCDHPTPLTNIFVPSSYHLLETGRVIC